MIAADSWRWLCWRDGAAAGVAVAEAGDWRGVVAYDAVTLSWGWLVSCGAELVGRGAHVSVTGAMSAAESSSRARVEVAGLERALRVLAEVRRG